MKKKHWKERLHSEFIKNDGEIKYLPCYWLENFIENLLIEAIGEDDRLGITYFTEEGVNGRNNLRSEQRKRAGLKGAYNHQSIT